ncbi:MAG: cation diffusion facilitator family transporter [Spirochaetia bacterium]
MNHTHDQGHSYSRGNYNRAFAVGVLLNTVFVAVEFGYGIFSDSLALIADAGHNLSDVVSLLLAWGAGRLATISPTEKRTYGFRKVTIMASLVSGILLMVAVGGITWESIGRFSRPAPVQGGIVIFVAAIGVLINTITALLFIKGQKHDLNIRGAFLHMAADAGVSVGVVVSGVLIMWTGWVWIDPVMSLLIVGVILIGTWGLLKESVNYAIDTVPKAIDLSQIKRYLLEIEQVDSLHDLHVWPLSTTEIALTVHLVVYHKQVDNNFLSNLQRHLHDRFGIEHATIQIESILGENKCMLYDS